MPDVLGVVPLLGRETLAFATFGGRPLFLSAVDALATAGIGSVIVLAGTGSTTAAREELASYPGVGLIGCPQETRRFAEAASTADVVVVHDPLCPLVSGHALRRVLGGWQPATAAVSVLPVVETVKAVSGDLVYETLDRESLRLLSSPVVIAGKLLAQLSDPAITIARPSALVEWLVDRCRVDLVVASPASQRVEDESSLRVLASLAVLARQREGP